MANGLKVVLPTTFTDATLPVLHDDSLLTAGSLLLVDLAHSANPTTGVVNLTSGVPTSGAILNNVAWKEAAALLGAGTQASLSGALTIGGAIGNLTKGKIERTGKGGLHGIVSQSTALASGDGMIAATVAAIRSYILANPSHVYYWSAWDVLTRINGGTVTATGAAEYEMNGSSLTAAADFLTVRADSIVGSAVPTSTHTAPGINVSAGARFLSVSETPAALTSLSANGFGPSWGASAGSYNNAVLSSRNTFWPSFAFYRLYLEDLTVSGRSYATVDALDYARFTTDVLTAGGRYYADTYTAVTAVP